MRVVVVYLGSSHTRQLRNISEGIRSGIEAQGATVDLASASELNRSLALYSYVVIVTESIGFFGGRIPGMVSEFLKGSGPLGGRRSCAILLKRGLRQNRGLIALMTAMEGEGMFVTDSFCVATSTEGARVGKLLALKRAG